MPDTPIQLINTVRDDFATIFRQVRRSVSQDWFQLDLTLAQVRVLFVLTRQRASTMSSIAQALGIGVPTASHLVEKLVRAGLVERSEHPKDRRQTLVHLTTAGEDLMEHLSQDRLEQVRLWLSQLNEEELNALHVGLEALSRVAQTAQPDAEPRHHDNKQEGIEKSEKNKE